MIQRLDPVELRVLGCLIEKQRTTPEQYPLTLNSLRLACNQSTNRDPVVQYDEQVIRDALHRLERRGFTRLASGRGSRAAKHRHLLAEALPMNGAEQAVMCVLMLRGPQTPGELKQRTERLHPFDALEDVHRTLEALIERELAARLERRPGQKEERYMQLLGADTAPAGSNGMAGAAPSHPLVARPVVPVASGAEPYAVGDAQSGAARDAQPYAPGDAQPYAAHEDPAALEGRLERLERDVTELRETLSELREAIAELREGVSQSVP